MSDPTDGLRSFLIARWAEESHRAHAALEALEGAKWTAIYAEEVWLGRASAPLPVRLHVTAQSPQHVIDDLAAKASILQHVTEELHDHGADNPWWYSDKLRPILEMLALPYASHPDYQPEWAPQR